MLTTFDDRHVNTYSLLGILIVEFVSASCFYIARFILHYLSTSIKNSYRKLQKEVGTIMPKSTQTRVVWMITKYNRHPYIAHTHTHLQAAE